MKSVLAVLALFALVATLHAAVPSYTWPTFKSNILSVDVTNNQTIVSSFYSDAKKQIIRFDTGIEQNGGMQKYIQFYEVNRYTIIYYTVGKDESIVCNYAKMNTSSMFGNLLAGATFVGLKALNTTVGLSYEAPLFMGAPVNFVIDAFTNYPAVVDMQQKENPPAYFVNASELSASESDAMLRIPKGITCKDISSKVRSADVKVVNLFKF